MNRQLEGIAEKACMANDRALFRESLHNHPETDHWIKDLSRPGRLTAGMNWYRANLSRLLNGEFPRVDIPVFGIWSTDDVALVEDQKSNSAAFVDAAWQYERMENVSHWIPVDEPEKLSNLIINFYQKNREVK